MPENPSTQKLTPQRIMQLAWGYAMPLAIEAAVKHRVFDVLDGGGKTVEQVAEQTGASVRGLRALMNMLVSIELLSKDGQQRYALTPESATFLVSTKPSFQGGIFKHISTQLIPKWMQLEQIVRSGKPAAAVNQENVGAAFFENFVEDIFPMSYAAAQALADALRVADVKKPVRVLDVASGSGVWGIALAQKSPYVNVIAVDWPGVLPVTKRVAQRHGVGERFKYVAGDLHSADFGRDFDVATLGHILHSEGETRSRALLKKVFASLAPGGTIAIAEFVANDQRTGPPPVMIFAVNMLVNTETGDTFTFKEISQWLREAGFADIRQLDSPGPSPLILANKPR